MELPIDFTNRMKAMLSDKYDAFFKEFAMGRDCTGIRITKPEAEKTILNTLENYEKVPWCPNGYYADKSIISGNHPYHAAGLVYFQEPSAMAAVSALPVNPGDRVLDLCASPGGKATQAAEKLCGSGLLVANEIVPSRAQILAENIERCGIKNAVVTNESPERLAEKFPQFFDKIIVDAPCSGEGLFRKNPNAVTEWSAAHTESCAVRQRHILSSAVKMLRPGGYLVYSTCTFAPCENEGNAAFLLSEFPELNLEPIGLPGLSDGNGAWAGLSFSLSDTKRIFPHVSKGEGHFIALFKKSGETDRPKIYIKENEPPDIYRKFENETFASPFCGRFILFKDHLYLLNADIDLDGIKTVRAGLYMGICKKGRFEPSHALALSCRAGSFKNTLNLSSKSREIKKYLAGEVLECDKKGWVCVLADGFPIGWGKAGGGTLKNHYPKKLRIPEQK